MTSDRKIKIPISLSKGDRVTHKKFGVGVVLNAPQDDAVKIRFDAGQQIKTILADGSVLVQGDDPAYWKARDPFQPEKDEWRYSVLEFEDESVEHDFVTLWESIIPDRADLMYRLPQLLEAATVIDGYASILPPPRNAPVEWSQGFAKGPGMSEDGALFTVAFANEQARVVNVTPYLQHREQLNVTLKRVQVWSNGVNAIGECDIGGISLHFFDNHCVSNRGWYYPDAPYTYLFIALAIECAPGIASVPLNFSDDEKENWRAMHAKFAAPPDAPEILQLGGMAAYLPYEAPSQDYAQFRGRLAEVAAMDIMGVQAWRVSIVFLRDLDQNDISMKMVIPSHAWRHDTPPAVGMDIDGILWMQGEMACPYWT